MNYNCWKITVKCKTNQLSEKNKSSFYKKKYVFDSFCCVISVFFPCFLYLRNWIVTSGEFKKLKKFSNICDPIFCFFSKKVLQARRTYATRIGILSKRRLQSIVLHINIRIKRFVRGIVANSPKLYFWYSLISPSQENYANIDWVNHWDNDIPIC